MGTEKWSATGAAVALGLALAAVVGGGLLFREFGGKSYQGKRAAEWRRLADDADPATKLAAFRALESVDPGALASRFGAEQGTEFKLIAAKAMMGTAPGEDRTAKYVEELVSDGRFGDLYLDNPDLRAIIERLALRGKVGAIESHLRKWATRGDRQQEAKALLESTGRYRKP